MAIAVLASAVGAMVFGFAGHDRINWLIDQVFAQIAGHIPVGDDSDQAARGIGDPTQPNFR
jgi:hypothetical protein